MEEGQSTKPASKVLSLSGCIIIAFFHSISFLLSLRCIAVAIWESSNCQLIDGTFCIETLYKFTIDALHGLVPDITFIVLSKAINAVSAWTEWEW